MANITVVVPNPAAPDVLAALEQQWSKEASRVFSDYSSLSDTRRAAACISVYLRGITKSYLRQKETQRRKALEKPIVIAEPDITP